MTKRPKTLVIDETLEHKLEALALHIEKKFPSWGFNLFLHVSDDDGDGFKTLYLGNVPKDESFDLIIQFIEHQLASERIQPPTSTETH